jgi:predicted ester cyclase
MGFLFLLKEIDLHFATFKPNSLPEHHSWQAIQITLKPVANVTTFNGHKKFEIIGLAQGGNMLKNSKHFVYIINEEHMPKMAALRHSG